MSNFFLNAHSGLRYLILLLGVVTVLYAIYGVVTKRDYDPKIRVLSSSFALMMHIQIMVGIALVFSGRFSPALTGHIFMMLFAAAAGQIPVSVMRRRPDEEKTYLPHAVWASVSLALMWGGMMAIGRPLVG